MKTEPMSHQDEALRRMDGREAFALFCEQGTGKTWMILADAEREYGRGTIDALLVVAPKGVDANWVLREIPEHLSAPHIARLYRSGLGKKAKAELEQLFKPRDEGEMPPLRILAMNYEALTTKDGLSLAQRFLNATKAMVFLDESRRIKNIKALRSVRVMGLKHQAKLRRIGTGTPMANAPLDIFGQMEFLGSGLLGTTSYRAFVVEYADLVAKDSHLMRHIKMRTKNKFAEPQVVVRNPDGTPRWKNLDKLQALLDPHSYRVLKKDCLDLPEKIYETRFFDLVPKLRNAYDKMHNELRLEFKNGKTLTAQRISSLLKLQQITSGFVSLGKGELVSMEAKPERLKLLLETIEDLPEEAQFIVFARFREEIRAISEALHKANVTHATYHGDTKDVDRAAAVDGFQSGKIRAFVAQTRAGGIGLTLTAASNVIYYSNSFDAEERAQSEDRAHRKGTRHNVVYTDLVARGTIDEPIAYALQRKQNLAAAILGDFSFPEKERIIAAN